jgi:hypothetical protein
MSDNDNESDTDIIEILNDLYKLHSNKNADCRIEFFNDILKEKKEGIPYIIWFLKYLFNKILNSEEYKNKLWNSIEDKRSWIFFTEKQERLEYKNCSLIYKIVKNNFQFMIKQLKFSENIVIIIEELFRRTRLCYCKKDKCNKIHKDKKECIQFIFRGDKREEETFQYIFELDDLVLNEKNKQFEIKNLKRFEDLTIKSTDFDLFHFNIEKLDTIKLCKRKRSDSFDKVNDAFEEVRSEVKRLCMSFIDEIKKSDIELREIYDERTITPCSESIFENIAHVLTN